MKSSIYLWGLLVFSYYSVVYTQTYSHHDGNGKNTALIAVISICGVVLVLFLAGLYYACCRGNIDTRKIESSDTFASLEQGQHTQEFLLKVIRRYTNNFSDKNKVGNGGFGTVYKAKLKNGKLVAVKRAKPEVVQGAAQFKTEIDHLSRVSHRNVLKLLGFCHDGGEQMLIYDYLPKGSLRAALSGKSGVRLSWNERLNVALGVARGLEYLHDHIDPPIIHRDIKSDNILLDDNLNAKVADFGLSKLLSNDKSHVITHAKGTFGYMDPEYCKTQWLTLKSDVYSFGLLMLELVTGSPPIGNNGCIQRVKETQDIHSVTDPAISSDALTGLKQFVDLAMTCLHDLRDERPSMVQLVKEIQNIINAGDSAINFGFTSGVHNYKRRLVNTNKDGTQYIGNISIDGTQWTGNINMAAGTQSIGKLNMADT